MKPVWPKATLSACLLLFLAACGGGGGGGAAPQGPGTPPPATCPEGQTGTPPNCTPEPPPPPATCPEGQTGTPPNCTPEPPPPPATCPEGQTGTPPNCTPEPPATGGGQQLQSPIATSFATTKTDYYPLDSQRIRPQPPQQPPLRTCETNDSECHNDNYRAQDEYRTLLALYEQDLIRHEEGDWRLVVAESDIASREHVVDLLRETAYNFEVEDVLRSSWILLHAAPPTVHFVEGTTQAERASTMRAIDQINAWLPWGKHITVGADTAFDAARDSGQRAAHGVGRNGIVVYFEPHSQRNLVPTGAGNGWYGGINVVSVDDHDVYGVTPVIVHELIHSLGLSGGRSCYQILGLDCDLNAIKRPGTFFAHVPVSQFPDSTMAYESPYGNWGGLSQIDGEAIQLLYHSLLQSKGTPVVNSVHNGIEITEDILSPENLGPWDETVVRYSGSMDINTDTYGPHGFKPAFGVDWRNGVARPWAIGGSDLWFLEPRFREFPGGLSGVATWSGEFVGFTPAREAVHGDTAINVDLDKMAGDAAFTALEHWGAGAAPGAPGTGAQWHDGDLHYSLTLYNYVERADDNRSYSGGTFFRSNGGDEDYVSGHFTGGSHGAVGILERPDLTGAFGAVRQ